jgi:hypothetical protein
MSNKVLLQFSEVIKRLFPKQYMGHSFKCNGVKEVKTFPNFNYEAPVVEVDVTTSQDGNPLSLFSFSALVNEKMDKTISNLLGQLFKSLNPEDNRQKTPLDVMLIRYNIDGNKSYTYMYSSFSDSIIITDNVPKVKTKSTGRMSLDYVAINMVLNYDYKLVRPGVTILSGKGNSDNYDYTDEFIINSHIDMGDITIQIKDDKDPLKSNKHPLSEDDPHSSIEEYIKVLKETENISNIADLLYQRTSKRVPYSIYLADVLREKDLKIRATPMIKALINEIAVEDDSFNIAFPHAMDFTQAMYDAIFIHGVIDLEVNFHQEIVSDRYFIKDEVLKHGTDSYLCYAVIKECLKQI